MKKALFGLMITVSCFSFAQKVKVKKEIAYVDGKEYLKVIPDAAARACYNLTSLNGNDLFYLKHNSYNDPMNIDYKTNPNGTVGYFEVLSADLNTVYFETHLTGCLMGCDRTENVVKMLFASKVIKDDGTIDMDKLGILSKKAGFEYSRKRDELAKNSTGNTVIIQDTRPRNGFNISIGR